MRPDPLGRRFFRADARARIKKTPSPTTVNPTAPGVPPPPMKESLRPELTRSRVGPARSAADRTTGRFPRLFGKSANLQATGQFLRRQLWAWPIIAAILLGLIGWWVSASVDDAMRDQRRAALSTILDAEVTSVRVWIKEQEINAGFIAGDDALQPAVAQLLAVAVDSPEAARMLLQSPAQKTARTRIERGTRQCGYHGFMLVGPGGLVLASDHDIVVGKTLGVERREFFEQVLAGRAAVSRPYRSGLMLADEHGRLRANLPSMWTAAPVRDQLGKPLAALGLRIRPDDQFTRILRVAQPGATGETFAFDKNGLFLSESRFDDDLKQVGLLADLPESQSILTVELRDPQVNLMTGRRPSLRRAEQPLTRMAADAVEGRSGADVDGYRDFRGVPVVGVWTWLPEYDFGIATEMEAAEAFRPLYILRRAFWILMALLILSAAGIFGAMLFMARQQRALQKAVLQARHLGQYTLESKLGAGGMGTVYRARHALLRRPTAVKLLDVDKISDAAIARFEREVQITSGLTHPNTVAIFDFGRTPEGIFFYAMEYLEGTNLDDLIARIGPLPEARVLYLLRQICGSLAEAHARGLVHRDVKPANIFLTCRGDQYDFVKVLDFGLVKTKSEGAANLTSANAVTGTPLYLSPEGVNRPELVDARSDVYAIGAVGYFLLTGTPVFSGESVMDICMKHMQTAPEPPSARLGHAIDRAIEEIILRCLAKAPADRPASASALLRELELCRIEPAWTAEQAAAWWSTQGTPGVGATTAIQDTARPSPDTDRTLIYDRPPM
jgi:eukaryotic-like serine/threonine-protein kinase